jgi:hypothetical protein
MRRKTALFFIVLIFGLVGCGGVGTQSTTDAASRASTSQSTASGKILLSTSPASLDFGQVNVAAAATQSVVLMNQGTSGANVSAVTMSGPFSVTGPTFPFTLAAGNSITLQASFAPVTAGAASGSMLLSANGNNKVTVNLIGSGVASGTPGGGTGAVNHLVTLTWGASTATVDGYYVYRSATSGGPYTRINATPTPQLTFADAAVTAGQTYFYVITATAADIESAYSNEVTAVIPNP